MAGKGASRPGIAVRIKAFLVWLIARLLLATLRMRVLNKHWREAALQSGRPILYAFWHGRQLALFKANPEQRLTVMTSLSRDGELQTRICRRFGLHVVRGSSSRSGLAGLLSLGRRLRGGSAVGVAVDGPRGPAYEAKPGIMALARASGSMVLPMTVGFRRCWKLGRTWDQFRIPKPFTATTVAYGEPLVLDRTSTKLELERATESLTRRLRALTDEVDAACEPSA